MGAALGRSQDVLSFRYEGPSCEEDLPGAYHIALLRAYNQVEPYMRERAILPERRVSFTALLRGAFSGRFRTSTCRSDRAIDPGSLERQDYAARSSRRTAFM